MNALRVVQAVALVCGLGALSACGSGQPSSTPASSSSNSLVANAIDHAMDRAKQKLRTENITISNHDNTRSLPKAQITPQGGLLIAGKAISITPAQRSMLLDYRGQLVAIAMQGMAIGKQGAALGMKATGEALAGVFSGKSSEQIQQDVQAQASGIKQSASKLCSQLPGLMASQQKLAASLPAFTPYATMTQADVDNCMKGEDDDEAMTQRRDATRDQVRSRIRSTIRAEVRGTGVAPHDSDSGGAASPASAGTTTKH